MLDFLNEDIFNVECDMLVVPISTEGTLSTPFKNGLKKFFPKRIPINSLYNLGDVEIKLVATGSRTKCIAFACTVDQFTSNYSAIRKIGKMLAKNVKNLKYVREIATPILGSGSGKLDPFYSRNIMLNAFYEDDLHKSARLTFCVPDIKTFYLFENLRLDVSIPSAQLAIKAEMQNINQYEIIKTLQTDDDFYYDLAKKKYHEYIEFKAADKSLYRTVEKNFISSNVTFQKYLSTLKKASNEYSFVVLCGELIAYIDYNAYRKNFWNKYPDKRVLAKSAVRQTDWFKNLIKFKSHGVLDKLSPSIANALKYLSNPFENITMLSEQHRLKVFKEILGLEPGASRLTEALFPTFRQLGFTTKNPDNFGALCGRILYLPNIKGLWHDDTALNDDGFIDEVNDLRGITQASTLIENCLNTQSASLDLGNCGITDLSKLPELFECIQLEELILSNEWPLYEKGKWKKIISSNTGEKNRLDAIPPELATLKKLRRLICGGDWNDQSHDWNRWSITTLGSIAELTQLEHLNVSNNKLSTIKAISKLKKLRTLHLNNNEIESVEDLSKLNLLTELLLSNNFIKNVSFLKHVKSLETIDLHNNRIADLRPLKGLIIARGISNDKWKVGTLNVAKNPLEQPPMGIVNIGKEAVLRNLEDVEKLGRYINKDIKIILVGNSEAGKSTLVKYLDNENRLSEAHPATLWMEEKVVEGKYTIKSIRENCILHIFDFGGHDYYHDTHHLFYSTNAIYILLWEQSTNHLGERRCVQLARSGDMVEVDVQDYPLKYWLDSVKHHIKDIEADNFEFEIHRETTYSSSLVLIQNKVSNVSKACHVNNEKLLNEYPFIFDIFNMSIKTPKRNMTYFDSLFTDALNCMKIVGAVLPRYYETVKNAIEKYKGKPVLDVDEFVEYCNSILQNPIDLQQGSILIKYLSQIGVLLSSESNGIRRIYIDKAWIIENMHKVLENLLDQSGEFKREYVENSLGALAKGQIESILEMMLEFRMIFKHPYKDSYIAPLYLPKMPEAKIRLFLNEKMIPFRRFMYSGFIKKNIVLSIFQKYTTLMSLGSASAADDTFYYWKDGLIMKKPGTTEIVMIKFHLGDLEGNAYIDIYDISNAGHKAIFILEIVKYIQEVNNGYDIEEMVSTDGVDFISKAVLERNATLGKLMFSERKMADFANPRVEERVFKLKDFKGYITESIKRKKVAISYSKKDLAHVHSLRRYLQPLVDSELIEEPWYCTMLISGDEWNLQIKQKFDEADIVFFMVSEYFYSTKYIVDHEIPFVIDRYDQKQSVKIIPVILEFYDWSGKPPYNLQRFSALPYQAKPISDFNNPKIAWNTITASVRIMIEKDLDPGKTETIGRDLQEIYERQVKGTLDKKE